MKAYSYIFLFLLFGLYLNAQEVSSSISKNSIEYGEPVILKLQVKGSKEDKVSFPIIKDSLSYHIEILSIKNDTAIQDHQYLYTDSIVFSIYEPGTFKVPSQKIIVNSKSYQTQPYEIVVSKLKTDSIKQPLYDIKPIIEEPKILSDYIYQYWVYIVLILIFTIITITIIILYYLENKKKKKLGLNKNPDIIAIKKLNTLAKSNYLNKGQSKIYYSELVAIIKEYIEARWSIRATKLLSDDLINHLSDNNQINKEGEQSLKIIFRSADLAKFAKSIPSKEDSQLHMKMAEDFIKETKTEFLNFRQPDEY